MSVKEEYMDQNLQHLLNNNQVIKCSFKLVEAASEMSHTVRQKQTYNTKLTNETLNIREKQSHRKFNSTMNKLQGSLGYFQIQNEDAQEQVENANDLKKVNAHPFLENET